jgi:hypothetical protein
MPPRPLARSLVAAALAASLGACASRPPLGPAVLPAPEVATPGPPRRPPLGPLADGSVARDEDGIAIMDVRLPPAETTGGVTWLPPMLATLDVLPMEASDGERIYFAASLEHGRHDVLVRAGEVFDDLTYALGDGRAATGCGAAAAGAALLVSSGDPGAQVPSRAFRIDPSGRLDAWPLPFGVDGECAAWLGEGAAFTVASSRLTVFDGSAFLDRSEPVSVPTLAHLAGASGPRHCDRNDCAEDGGPLPHDRETLSELRRSLGACAPLVADRQVATLGDHAAMTCPSGWIARVRRGGEVELAASPLPPSSFFGGAYDVALTRDGDVVVFFDASGRAYSVWRRGTDRPGPVRQLPPGERMSLSSPPIHLRGLASPLRAPTVSAVLLAPIERYGLSGVVGYARPVGGETARAAQAARVRAVMPAEDLLLVGEAAVDARTGAYVRAPLGFEGVGVMDWVPPTMPPLDPRSVQAPRHAIGIEEIVALPGDPDLLLARTSRGTLAAAWLSPPIALPLGFDPRRQRAAPPPPAPEAPLPGTGFVEIEAQVVELEGERGTRPPERPDTEEHPTLAVGPGFLATSPDRDREVWDRPYYRAGGALVRLRDGDVVVMPGIAARLPGPMVPQAALLDAPSRLYGSVGRRLVVCETTCRSLDPGPGRTIARVVPRDRSQVVLTYDDGRSGVFEVPPTGGVDAGDSGVARALRAVLRSKPSGRGARP